MKITKAQHKNQYYTNGHMSKVNVKVGDRVKLENFLS